MGFDVKNTTFFSPLDLIAPFSCRGCGRLGWLLCECCKKYNVQHLVGLYTRSEGAPIYAVSYREGVMMRLVEDYKYKSIRATAKVLAEMMARVVPEIAPREASEAAPSDDIVVVPLPTIGRHIRERGFDHMLLIAKKLAKIRGFKVERVLERRNKTVQVGADEEKRKKQAKSAYGLARRYTTTGSFDVNKTYLLIDDVYTTGASMRAAIKVMKEAGAKKTIAAVILVPKQ